MDAIKLWLSLTLVVIFSTVGVTQVSFGTYEDGEYNAFNTFPEPQTNSLENLNQVEPENKYSGGEISDEYCEYLLDENENLEVKLNQSRERADNLEDRLNTSREEKESLKKELNESKDRVKDLEKELELKSQRIQELEDRSVIDLVAKSVPETERITAAFSRGMSKFNQNNP